MWMQRWVRGKEPHRQMKRPEAMPWPQAGSYTQHALLHTLIKTAEFRFSDLICSYLVIILLLFYLWISSGWYPIYLMLCFQFPSSLFFVFKQYFMSLKGDILYSFSGSYWHRFRVYNCLILSSAAAPYSPSMWHCSCQLKKINKKYTRGKQNGHQL